MGGRGKRDTSDSASRLRSACVLPLLRARVRVSLPLISRPRLAQPPVFAFAPSVAPPPVGTGPPIRSRSLLCTAPLRVPPPTLFAGLFRVCTSPRFHAHPPLPFVHPLTFPRLARKGSICPRWHVVSTPPARARAVSELQFDRAPCRALICALLHVQVVYCIYLFYSLKIRFSF